MPPSETVESWPWSIQPARSIDDAIRLALLTTLANDHRHRTPSMGSHGINKGQVATAILREAKHVSGVLAAGDDSTDEDLFRALPANALTIRVGPGHSAARYRLPDVPSLRAFLAETGSQTRRAR